MFETIEPTLVPEQRIYNAVSLPGIAREVIQRVVKVYKESSIALHKASTDLDDQIARHAPEGFRIEYAKSKLLVVILGKLI